VAGGWRKFHVELRNLDWSPNVMMKSKNMRWKGHVASMGRWKMHTKFWLEKL